LGQSNESVAGEVKDRHVVILDDLVQTGGTLIECAKASGLTIYFYACIHLTQGAGDMFSDCPSVYTHAHASVHADAFSYWLAKLPLTSSSS